MPQCAKERAKARAEEPSEAPAAAAGRDHYAIIGTRNLATSGFKSRLRSMKVSSRINGEFRFMTGENINSAIISDMGRNGLWVHNGFNICSNSSPLLLKFCDFVLTLILIYLPNLRASLVTAHCSIEVASEQLSDQGASRRAPGTLQRSAVVCSVAP